MKQIKTCLVIFAGLFALASMSCVSTNRYEKTTESTYQDGKLIGQAITLRKDGKIVSKTSSEMRSADISGIHADVLIESSEKESYDKTNIKLYKNGAFIGEKNFKTKNGRISSEITDSATTSSSKDDKYKELIDYGDFVFVEGLGKVQSFYAAKKEVTQADYNKVMGVNPSSNKGDNLPVESLSFFDALEYCNKLSSLENRVPAYTLHGTTWNFDKSADGYRLLTIDEHRFASQGGNLADNFEYAGSNTPGDVAWYKSNSGKHTHPVAKKKANSLGLYDMSGNVSEWVWDGSSTTVCGGSAWDAATGIRVTSSLNVNSAKVYEDVGFRIARNVSSREKQAFTEKKKLSGKLDSYFINAFKEVNKKNKAQSDETEDSGKIDNITEVEQVTVNSTPNTPYIVYSFLGKPFVIVGATAWNLVKCSGYALINFVGGYSTITEGKFMWVMPDTKKAKEKAALARKNNGISHYPEYHKAFTNNTIEVYRYKQNSENQFSKLEENEVKVYDVTRESFDNSISVSRSAAADANSTAAVIGLVGTGVTVPVSVITWGGGAAAGIYMSIMGKN